jgi:hypothetical protein
LRSGARSQCGRSPGGGLWDGPHSARPGVFNQHVPLAKTVPGLRGYEVSRGDVDLANFASAGVDVMMSETTLI